MNRFNVLAAGILILCATVPARSASVDSCVAEKLEPSLGILQKMMSGGLDLAKPRQVSQLFYGSSTRRAAGRKALAMLGYSQASEPPSDRLLVVMTTPLSEAWVRATINQMCAVAASSGLDYDGWDIDVSADNIQPETKP